MVQMLASSFFLIVVGVCDLVLGQEKNDTFKTPDYIIPCYKADPEINKCLLHTFNHLRPYLQSGIKDINVPSIDPLKIDRLLMENGQGGFRIRALFHNVTASGGSNYTISKIKADIDNYNIDFSFNLPRVEIKGKYEVNGNVLLFPVRSKGDFWAIFLNVDAAAKIYGKEFKDKSNTRFMKIERMMIDFKMQKSRFRIKDNINHGNIIGEAMNQFLNSNAEDIIAEMKPAANTAIAKHFKSFLNSAFLKLPLKLWLPDA